MTSQIEEWSFIFCVIIPVGFYLMLAGLNYIDNKSGRSQQT